MLNYFSNFAQTVEYNCHEKKYHNLLHFIIMH